MLASELKSHLVDKLKDSAADGKTESRAWVGLGRVQSFMLILGRVGLDHFTCGSGWVGSRKLDPRTTLSAGGSGGQDELENSCRPMHRPRRLNLNQGTRTK